MLICEPSKCVGCLACVDKCPVGAIKAVRDGTGFCIPEVDSTLCIGCGACQKVCPAEKKSGRGVHTGYAAYNKDPEIRKNSSSGGMFYELAMNTLRDGGAVCGVGYGENLKAVHKIITDEKDLSELMGSKYVQSDTSGIWSKIKELLDSGKKVLFSGTPCQCAALHSYLGKDYDNLLAVDLVCHGVPSPMLWEKYINENYKSAKYASFRDKTHGWDDFSMRVEHEGGTYLKSKNTDPYLRLFLTNKMLRECCGHCNFKGDNYYGDITIADFWGIFRVFPEMLDDKGVSSVIVRTPKGEEAFDRIKDRLIYKECSEKELLSGNVAINTSSKFNPDMGKVKKMLEDGDSFSEISDKYCKSVSRKDINIRKCAVAVKVMYSRIFRIFHGTK